MVMERTNLIELDETFLVDSCVLGIVENRHTFLMVVDLALTELHPLYSDKKEDEWTVFKRSVIAFDGVKDLIWKHKDLRFTTDPDGTIDFGNIHGFYEIDGKYTIEGDLGEITFYASQRHVHIFR